jgi:hypothetical protein
MSATSHNFRFKSGGDPRPQLDSVNLAEIRARYVGSRIPAAVAADMEALWLEVDRLRFALAGAEEAKAIAQRERQKSDDQIYQLLSTRPGAGGPI